MSDTCAVALVDRRDVALAEWTLRLSVRERAEVATYRHSARRARTVKSRILAKFLVTQSDTADFHRLRAAEVESAWTSEGPSVELLSGTSLSRREATVFRGGIASSDVSASSSHCGPYTASCISRRCRVGAGLEIVEPRRQEFYAGMFSAEERDWVAEMHANSGAAVEAAIALLWCVKEAYLKVSARRDINIWAFPR